jgi:hypothetical protein
MALPRALELRRQMGSRLVLSIDPQKVGGWVWSELPLAKAARKRPSVKRLPPRIRGILLARIALRHPYVLSPRRFPTVVPFDADPTARWVTDLVINHRGSPRDSLWYRHMCRVIQEVGRFDHAAGPFTRPDQAEEFLSGYLLPIVDSIEREGYRIDVSGEIGFALLDADGTVLKTKRATHRFFIARALGQTSFPVQIAAVHASWWSSVMPDAPHPRRPADDWQERLAAAIASIAAAHATP